MPRTKNGSPRVSAHRIPKTFELKIGTEVWTSIENEIFKRPLSEVAKKKINYWTGLYVAVASIHGSDKAITLTEAEKALTAWLKSTRRLQTALKKGRTGSIITKEDLFEKMRAMGKKKMPRGSWMPMLADAIDLVASMATLTLQVMDKTSLDPNLKTDIWLCWVRLLEVSLEEEGVDLRLGPSEQADEAPFIQAIHRIQHEFPTTVQIRKTPQSISKGVRLARRALANLNETSLHGIIVGFGSGFLREYTLPGFKNSIDWLLSKSEGPQTEN